MLPKRGRSWYNPMTTKFIKVAEVKRAVIRIDANGKILGRLAVEITKLLMGKDKHPFSPHVDAGDFVEVINFDKFKVSADKLNSKLYRRYTGYPGGLRTRKLRELKPGEAIQRAVSGMLPKNSFRARRLARLRFIKK